MKSITIRLPDVEAAMLAKLQIKDKRYKNLDSWLARQVVDDYVALKTH